MRRSRKPNFCAVANRYMPLIFCLLNCLTKAKNNDRFWRFPTRPSPPNRKRLDQCWYFVVMVGQESYIPLGRHCANSSNLKCYSVLTTFVVILMYPEPIPGFVLAAVVCQKPRDGF
jgi:hypothetical protein